MSNNRQNMKLYTEEQMHTVMLLALGRYEIHSNRKVLKENQDLIDSLTPIQLPSDEEVEQYLKSFPYTKHLDDGQYNDGKIVGAELAIQWFRNKIQGGNK